MIRIIVARHGNTFAPHQAPLRIGRRTDLALVASGREQAAALGAALAALKPPIERIFCGPLLRARETAQIASQALADAPYVEPQAWLNEIDHGAEEGLEEAEVRRRLGMDALDAWDRLGDAPEGWIVDADCRQAAWRRFYVEVSKPTLLCTSNGAARFALLAHPALASAARQLPSLKLRTGAWGEIRVGEKGDVRLHAWDVRPAAD